MIAAVFLVFGLIIGSFLNVLVARWGRESLGGRSRCGACRREIAWYDLIPILSWLMLRARCRACGSRISVTYPLVEAGTGILFFFIGLAPLPLSVRLLALPIAALLFAIALYDLKHTLIPDRWVYSFAGLSLLASFVMPSEVVEPIAILLAGPIVALPLFALWFFSRGAWMGFGDVKFAVGMGWLLGWQSGLLALFLAFIIGALVSVPLLFFSSDLWKRVVARLAPDHFLHRVLKANSATGFTMKSEIPFGPFLIAATLIVWFSNMYGIGFLELLTEGALL